ncbi:unnamed protein product, partial [Callosobruchus maculatus]
SPKSDHHKPSSTAGCKKSRSQQHSTPTAALSAPASASTSPTLRTGSLVAQQPTGGATSGECSTASSGASSPAAHVKTTTSICDKQPTTIDSLFANNTTTVIATQLPTLPDFNGFQRPATAAVAGTTDTVLPQETTATQLGAIHSPNKVPIPRLQTSAAMKLKQQAAAAAAVAKLQHAKYKLLQPRQQQQQPQCDITQSYNPQTVQAEGHRSQTVTNDLVDRIKERRNEGQEEDEVVDFPLTRERINSVSNVEKDAMDEYLGTNNEHDEELSKYFSNNNVNEPAQQDNTYKLSH